MIPCPPYFRLRFHTVAFRLIRKIGIINIIEQSTAIADFTVTLVPGVKLIFPWAGIIIVGWRH